MMDAMQPKTPDAVLAGLNQHGASIGAKKVCFICLVFKFFFFCTQKLIEIEIKRAVVQGAVIDLQMAIRPYNQCTEYWLIIVRSF